MIPGSLLKLGKLTLVHAMDLTHRTVPYVRNSLFTDYMHNSHDRGDHQNCAYTFKFPSAPCALATAACS